jgi:hypothetical protein
MDVDIMSLGDSGNGFTPFIVSEGDAFSAWCGVFNWGDNACGPFDISFYLSTDTTINTGDYFLGNTSVAGMGGYGMVSDCTWTGTFPSGIPGGKYYVGWILDSNDDVAETNETNNAVYKIGYVLFVDNGSVVIHEADCYPKSEMHWTGYVWGTSSKYNDGITIYHPSSGTEKHGWIKFDISGLPADADVISLTVHMYVSAVPDSFSACRVRHLPVDPVTSSNSNIYNSAGSYVADPQALSVTGWKEFPCNAYGFSLFAESLPDGWFAIKYYGC